MLTTNEQVIGVLNQLIAVCKEGERQFRTASAAVKEPELRALFKQYAHQRARLASELRMEVRLLGGADLFFSESILAAESAESSLIDEDERTLIAACEREEEETVQAYEAAFDDINMPMELHVALRRQFAQIRESYDRIKELSRTAVV
jgi:uncharacterized protein (TIGR02284 family)